jgi:hydrogenase maturation protease
MSTGRILIAGIGNIFFGDDAFGVEVARRLAGRPLPEAVRVVDFGIRGLDLAYALLDAHDAVILVDAVSRGGQPGTLYVLEPEFDAAEAPDGPAPLVEPHALDPWKVLHLARSLGATLDRVLLVGCEPGPIDPDDLRMEMSQPVQAAVGGAVRLIESLVTQARSSGSLRPCEHGGQPDKG